MSKRIFKKCKKKNVYQQRERESIKLFLHPTISKLEDLLNCQVAVREPKKWVSFWSHFARETVVILSILFLSMIECILLTIPKEYSKKVSKCLSKRKNEGFDNPTTRERYQKYLT